MGSLPERHWIPVPAYHDDDTRRDFLNSLSGSSAKALSNDVVENTTIARNTRDILFTGSSLGVNRGNIPPPLQAWELFGSVSLTFGINVIWQWNVKLLSLSPFPPEHWIPVPPYPIQSTASSTLDVRMFRASLKAAGFEHQ